MKEVAFCIQDRGVHKKGDPVAVRPVGIFVTAAEMLAWIEEQREPAGLAAIDPLMQAEWRRVIDEARTMGDADDGLATAACQAAYPNSKPHEWPAMIAESRRARAVYLAQGFDTSWGDGDRKAYGIVLTDEDDEAKILEKTKDAVPVRQVDYTQFLDPTSKTNMEKRDVAKMVNRSVVVDKAELLKDRVI